MNLPQTRKKPHSRGKAESRYKHIDVFLYVDCKNSLEVLTLNARTKKLVYVLMGKY